MATLNAWDVTDANNNAAPPDGWPENTMQYSEVNNTGRAVQGTMKRYYADVNGSLQAGGVADAYTLTLNETGYTAYFQGMFFACEINATNTGASTIDVNGIGAQNIIARNGAALVASTLEAGGIYEFRYDGTDFQLMGTLGAGVSIDQATLGNSAAVDLVDTDVALRTGAADPDTAQHLEITLNEIQSKSNATTAANISINPLGGNTNIYQGNFFGTLTTDPTAGDDADALIQYVDQAGTLVADTGYESGGSSQFRCVNYIWEGSFSVNIADVTGTLQEFIYIEPGSAGLYAPNGGGWEIEHDDGETALQTTITGIQVRGTTGNDSQVAIEDFSVNDASVLLRNSTDGGALMQLNSGDGDFEIRQLSAAGSNEDFWIDCHRNGSVDLFYDDTMRFTTSSTGATITGDEGLRIDQTGGTLGLHLIDSADRWTFGLDSNELVIRDETNTEEMVRLISGGIAGEQHFLINSDDCFVVTDETAQVYGRVASNLPGYEWFLNTGTRLAYFRYDQSAGELQLRSERVEGDIVIEATNASSTVRRILTGDPDGITQLRGFGGVTLQGGATGESFIVCTLDNDVALFDDNIEVAFTNPPASGGFAINNTLTGIGFERALTLSDLGDGQVKKVLDAFQIQVGVGFENATLTNVSGFSVTLRSDSANENFRLAAVLFVSNETTAGTNPGMRARVNSTGTETATSTYGTAQSNYGSNQFSYQMPLDATVTTISINDTASGVGSFHINIGFTPVASSSTIQLQLAQNVTNAAADTFLLATSNMQIYDYETS